MFGRDRLIRLLQRSGGEPVGSAPEVFAKKFSEDVAKYARMVKETKIPPRN